MRMSFNYELIKAHRTEVGGRIVGSLHQVEIYGTISVYLHTALIICLLETRRSFLYVLGIR